jgi:hypothetical protein
MPVAFNRFPIFFAFDRLSKWTREITSRGGPRNADSQASDTDAICIDPVHARRTVGDGVDRCA